MSRTHPVAWTRTAKGLPAWTLVGTVAALLAGCLNLAPAYERPAAPIPAQLPQPAQTVTPVAPLLASSAPESLPRFGDDGGGAGGDLARPSAAPLLRDERLRRLVDDAVTHNRDLRIALLNVERSRAQLRLAQADRWPTLGLGASAVRAPSVFTGEPVNSFQAGLQMPAFELDLFGRLARGGDAAAAGLLASEAAARAARLALHVQVAQAWFALAADRELLALARATEQGRAQTLHIAELRVQVGAASDVELHATRALLTQTQAASAALERQLAANQHALALLVGRPLAAEELEPPPLGSDVLAYAPAYASSDVLLQRPDVLQAEQALIAAQAQIGAARATYFPRITLTGSAGVVSETLRGLLQSGTFAWTLGANAAMTLLDAGRTRAQVAAAEASRDVALAQYEKTVQLAFRDAADALTAQSSWRDQVAAHLRLQGSERERLRLTRLRYEAGVANLVELLDAERAVASADQALVLARLGELINRLALYKALGGA